MDAIMTDGACPDDMWADTLIVDVDTHLTEAADLWTSRAPAKFRHRVPQIKVLDGKLSWVIDEDKLLGPAYSSSAILRDGSKAPGVKFLEVPIENVHEGAYDLNARIEFMDEQGIHAQLVYPNVLGFGGHKSQLVDPELRLLSTQIFNDAMAEMQENSNGRLYGMALLPWWDIKETMAELERCTQMGLRGVNTNSDPQSHGLPDFSQPHWFPLWERAQDMGLPVNFHIGASDDSMSWFAGGTWPSLNPDQQIAYGATACAMGNFRVLSMFLLSGVLDRFPALKLVSVESGLGWIPFLLECLEYQMRECGLKIEATPKEVFRRQIYACSWFERENLVHSARTLGIDNVMFETDYPHPTCLYPDALGYLAEAASEFTPEERRKVFGGNAMKVYNISPL